MRILDDLISTLKPDGTVGDVRQGPFWTAVATRNCGLASTPHYGEQGGAVLPEVDVTKMIDKTPSELIGLTYSDNILESAIGMAAVNSLLEVDEDRCIELNAADFIEEAGRGKKLAIVGHFPFVDRLRESASETWVIEKAPREGDLAEEEAQRVLPEADVIAITGSAFVNHSIEGLLGLCPQDSQVIVLGPTTPLSPVLFDYGVDVISGTRIVDADTVLRQVSEGLTFRQMSGVRLLTMRKR
jgi:hypothetical protein